MSPLAIAHLVLVSMWGGLVLCETVIELAGEPEQAAALHFWIDVLVELPIIAGVAVTGAILLTQVPLTTALAIKVAAASVAIAANLYCAVAVAIRYRRRHSAPALHRLGRHVRASIVALPFALVAAWVGLSRLL